MTKRAAIYVRVSTDKQTVENQLRDLRQIAGRRGWEVVEEYHDAGISGAKESSPMTTLLSFMPCFGSIVIDTRSRST